MMFDSLKRLLLLPRTWCWRNIKSEIRASQVHDCLWGLGVKLFDLLASITTRVALLYRALAFGNTKRANYIPRPLRQLFGGQIEERPLLIE